jgi:hypothetical protein
MKYKISLLFALFISSLIHAQTMNLTVYNTTTTPVFTTNSFKTVGVGKGGYIYAGTANAGLYKFNGSSWEKLAVLTNNNINDIQTDKNNGIWIAQYGTTGAQALTGGVNYLPDSTLTGFAYYGATLGLPTRNCRGIFIDTTALNQGNPRVWTANMAHITAGVSTTGAVGLGLNTNSPYFNKITAGVETTNGIGSIQTIGGNNTEIWAFASNNFGRSQILRYDANTAANTGAYDYLNPTGTGMTSTFTAKSIYFDSDGRQWVGLQLGGLLVKNGSLWTSVNMGEILPLNVAINNNAIAEDKFGNIYIGTTNGLLIYKGGSLTDISSYERYTTVDGLPSNNILDICEEKISGRIIIATDNGIAFWSKASPISALLAWDYSCPPSSVQPKGVVADGVSRLFIKVKKGIPGANNIKEVVVSIKDTANRNSSLWGRVKKAINITSYSDEASTGGSSVTSRTDSTSQGEFWFWYLSPEDFSRDKLDPEANLSERADTIKVKVIYANDAKDSADLVVKIVRPPLVMVHGLASDSACWKNFHYNTNVLFNESPLFKHKKAMTMHGEAEFDVNANLLLAGDYNSLGEPFNMKSTLQGNLDEIRKKGYAANQVDYVCHSMGGLMLRRTMDINTGKFFANNTSYKYNNYGKGFVHKLITINTPHNSSPVADAVTEYLPQITDPCHVGMLSLLYWAFPQTTYLGGFMEPDDPSSFFSTFRASGAVRNLRVSNLPVGNLSGGIDVGTSQVKNHMIIGDVDYNFLTSVGNFAIEMKPILKILDFLLDKARDEATGYAKAYLTGLYYLNNAARGLGFIEWYSQQKGFPNFLGDGDLIVPIASQTARQNIPLPNITRFGNSPTSIWDACHVKIVSRTDVGQRVLDLLNSNVGSTLFADNIPANNDPEPLPDLNDRVNTVITNSYDTTKIKITSPASVNTVHADSTLTISINLKDTVGLAYIKVYFQDMDSATLSREVNQQFTFTISPESPNMQKINAIAVYDIPNGTEYHIDTLSLNVDNLAILQGFKVEEDTVDITAGESYFPEYKAMYNGTWVSIPNDNTDISVELQNTSALNYTAQNYFVALQPGATAAYINYKGLRDTILFKSFLPLNSNCINKTIASGNLRNPAIWSKGLLPDICDSVVIESGHSVMADTSLFIHSLRINTGATLTLQDSTVQINIGTPDEAKQLADNYGNLIISKGILNINGKVLFQPGSSFSMTGGSIVIDGNNGSVSKSIPDGSHLFNASASMQSFSFNGGMLQIIDPPLGAGSQAINCSFNFGDNSVLKLGNGLSVTGSNNVNGFGGNLLPAQIGKMIFDPATSLYNRIFINLNPLNIRSSLDVRSGNLKQQALLKLGSL